MNFLHLLRSLALSFASGAAAGAIGAVSSGTSIPQAILAAAITGGFASLFHLKQSPIKPSATPTPTK